MNVLRFSTISLGKNLVTRETAHTLFIGTFSRTLKATSHKAAASATTAKPTADKPAASAATPKTGDQKSKAKPASGKPAAPATTAKASDAKSTPKPISDQHKAGEKPQAEDPDQNLTGLSKHFNSQTDRGRANVAKVTILSIFIAFIYYKMKPKKKPVALEAAKEQ